MSTLRWVKRDDRGSEVMEMEAMDKICAVLKSRVPRRGRRVTWAHDAHVCLILADSRLSSPSSAILPVFARIQNRPHPALCVSWSVKTLGMSNRRETDYTKALLRGDSINPLLHLSNQTLHTVPNTLRLYTDPFPARPIYAGARTSAQAHIDPTEIQVE